MIQILLAAISGALAFPDLVAQQPGCTFYNQQRSKIFAGSYLFNDFLFQDSSVRSVKFYFEIQTNAECFDLPQFYQKDGSSLGTVSRNDRNVIQLSGQIKDWSNQWILEFPLSSDCVYEFVQGFIAFDIQKCRMGQILQIEKEDVMRQDMIDSPDDLDLMRQGMIDSPDEDKPVHLPTSINGMLLIDGLTHFNEYRMSLPDQEQNEYHFAVSRARQFTTGDLSQPDVATLAAISACNYLNQYIRDPEDVAYVHS